MSNRKKIPVILDGDPGHDDAIAWVLAHASERLDILAVTTAAGNQTIEKTTIIRSLTLKNSINASCLRTTQNMPIGLMK